MLQLMFLKCRANIVPSFVSIMLTITLSLVTSCANTGNLLELKQLVCFKSYGRDLMMKITNKDCFSLYNGEDDVHTSIAVSPSYIIAEK